MPLHSFVIRFFLHIFVPLNFSKFLLNEEPKPAYYKFKNNNIMTKKLLSIAFCGLLSTVAFASVAATSETGEKLCLTLKTGSGVNVYNMYDAANNIYRVKETDSGHNGPLNQHFYNYTDGVLTETYTTQYKDMGEWTNPQNFTTYTYDDNGRLVKSENTYSKRLKEYTYDSEGRLVTLTEKGKNYGSDEYDKLYSTSEYSQFDANNNPCRLDYYDGLYASGNYYAIFVYDEKGRCTCETQYNLDDTPSNKYEYEYNDDDIVTSFIKSRCYDVEFEYATRETRTHLGDNVYTFTMYNYFDGWEEYRSYTEYYVNLKGEYAPRNLVLADISTPEEPNAIELTCDVPAEEVPNAQYIIWRAATPVDTVAAVDGKIVFTEKALENTEHEYVVQSYDAVNNILYNVSDAERISFSIELEPVSNLRYIKTTEGLAGDAQGGQFPVYWVHFEWDAPVTDLEVLGYNVYEQGWATPNKTTVNTTDSLMIFRESNYFSPDQQKQVGVEITAVYSYGESERVSAVFEVENVAVEAVTTDRVYLAGDYIVADAPTQVVIYNAAGAVVATHSNANRVYLGELPAGVYVARVKTDGKPQVLKISR